MAFNLTKDPRFQPGTISPTGQVSLAPTQALPPLPPVQPTQPVPTQPAQPVQPQLTATTGNAAFQQLIDSANQIIADFQAQGGALTPEALNSINQINNFELRKTAATAKARAAADAKDTAALDVSIRELEEVEREQGTEVDVLIERLGEARVGFVETLTPSERETELRRSLQELRSGREMLPLELRQEGISAAGIAARQVGDERVRAIQEGNLLFELGLEQEARQFRTATAEQQISFIQDDIDVQFKIEEAIRKQEQDILKEARTLRKESISALSDIVDQFEGLAFEDLDVEAQAELLDTARSFGIPVNLLSAALSNAKRQQVFDNALKLKREERLGDGGFFDSEGNEISTFDAARSIIEANPNASENELMTAIRESVVDNSGKALLSVGDAQRLVRESIATRPPPTVEEIKQKIIDTLKEQKDVFTRKEAKTAAENQLKVALKLKADQALPKAFKDAIEDALVEVYGRTFFQKILPGGR